MFSSYAGSEVLSASAYGRMFHALFHTPVVMPRVFMTYGPDQKDTQKLVPYVVRSLLQNEAPKIGNGTRLVDWIFVDDVVEGLLRAATIEGIEGASFDLGSGRLISIRQMVEQIVKVMESELRPQFGAVPDRPLEQERAADTTFLKDRLGWTPQTPLRRGRKQRSLGIASSPPAGGKSMTSSYFRYLAGAAIRSHHCEGELCL